MTESESHHCPQLEALQEQLRLLEEENEQLWEEVRMGGEGVLLGRGCRLPGPFLSPSLQVSQLDDLEEEEQIFILDCVEQFCT